MNLNKNQATNTHQVPRLKLAVLRLYPPQKVPHVTFGARDGLPSGVAFASRRLLNCQLIGTPLKTNECPLKINGWFRCIPYWNSSFKKGTCIRFQGGGSSHYLQGFSTIPGGWEWDFWTINRIDRDHSRPPILLGGIFHYQWGSLHYHRDVFLMDSLWRNYW